MCKHELVGDYYRGCGHFHGRYYSGEITDCMSETCKSSASHKHKTAKNCGCLHVSTDDAKVQNMFQIPHPDCQRTSR